GYAALASDTRSRSYACNTESVRADCYSFDQTAPNFSQLCYDAARIATVETVARIGVQLQRLRLVNNGDSSPCAPSDIEKEYVTSSGPHPISGNDDRCTAAIRPLETHAGCAVTDLSTHLVRLAQAIKGLKDWCANDLSLSDGLCMRAVGHQIYTSLCHYYEESEYPYLDPAARIRLLS